MSRVVSPDRVAGLVAEAAALPAITLDDRELADFERIATGAARPLTGFLGEADYRRALAERRLPLVLAVEGSRRDELRRAGAAALVDRDGRLRGVLRDAEVFGRDPVAEVRAVYGTDDVHHPGVADTLARPRWLVGGAIDALPLPRRAVTAAPPPGFILWFTGMSGAGKSTLSAALAARLAGTRPLEVLDGDEVRTHLSKGLGFSRADRDVNVHRIGFVARTLARHGVGVVTAAISPYAETRAEIRALAEAAGIAFVEVFAHAELGALIQRDPKGLYKKALVGEITHFTGVSDPYEPPVAADVVVHTDRESIDESLARIVAALAARGLIRAVAEAATASPHAVSPEARQKAAS